MVVIVPAFAHRNERENEIVPAVVAGHISLGTIDVRQRINRAGAMDEGDG